MKNFAANKDIQFFVLFPEYNLKRNIIQFGKNPQKSYSKSWYTFYLISSFFICIIFFDSDYVVRNNVKL